MAGAALGPALLGAAVTLGTTLYSHEKGFAARHEQNYDSQVALTQRLVEGFAKAHRDGDVDDEDHETFIRLRDNAIETAKDYSKDILDYKRVPTYKVPTKVRRKSQVRTSKRKLRHVNGQLQSHYCSSLSGCDSDASSIAAQSGSPPGSGLENERIRDWTYNLSSGRSRTSLCGDEPSSEDEALGKTRVRKSTRHTRSSPQYANYFLRQAKRRCDKDLSESIVNFKDQLRKEHEVQENNDDLDVHLYDIIAIAADVSELSLAQLTSPKCLVPIIRRLQDVGKVWGEHPDRPGRHRYVETLHSVTTLNRTVEWCHAERQSYWDSDKGDNESSLDSRLGGVELKSDHDSSVLGAVNRDEGRKRERNVDSSLQYGEAQRSAELSSPVVADISPSNEKQYLGKSEMHMHTVEETLSRMELQGNPMMGPASDLQIFIRPLLDRYIRTSNRLAFGERSVMVMSSKVAQKSYGTEKRFLCPPPTAILIGNSWWSDVVRRNDEPKHCPPRVVVSISGEPAPQAGSIEWTTSNGMSFDVDDPPPGTTYIGRCVGKQLFISDVDAKGKRALAKVIAPGSDNEIEQVIGIFPSPPIKVISKPSKKTKNLELCINHGSTISLFHRLRFQTFFTRYLCVSNYGSSFKGSDGAPMLGLDQRATTPSFIARTAGWDPFIIYIVDVTKPAGGLLDVPPPPPQPDYPFPPPSVIPFTNNFSQLPIYYNQTVILQCLTSGVVSPVFIIRKVDHSTTAVGGGLLEGAKGMTADHYCAPDEVCGDPVTQLHKVAFEVYDPTKNPPEPRTPGVTGAFLSCMGEKVNTYRPIEGRHWNTTQGTDPREIFDVNIRRRPRPSSGALWNVDIGGISVWTIVGTDQIRYNFYVPPVLFDNQNAPHTGSFPVPARPVTPFPSVIKYLPPDRASEARNCSQSRALLAKPNPHTSKMLTLYGENFNKADPVSVFFGSEPSFYVEVRGTEAIGCLPPESEVLERRPIILVRSDGVVFPSGVMYP